MNYAYIGDFMDTMLVRFRWRMSLYQ